MQQRQWADDNPFFLLVRDNEGGHVVIDLGETGWSKTYEEWMRRPGGWYLCVKMTGQIKLVMTVILGEQPYYTKRHIGQVSTGGEGTGKARETSCYGIGKKRLDGHVDRLWILPDGQAVCGGDDVEAIAMEVVQTLEWQEQS